MDNYLPELYQLTMFAKGNNGHNLELVRPGRLKPVFFNLGTNYADNTRKLRSKLKEQNGIRFDVLRGIKSRLELVIKKTDCVFMSSSIGHTSRGNLPNYYCIMHRRNYTEVHMDIWIAGLRWSRSFEYDSRNPWQAKITISTDEN